MYIVESRLLSSLAPYRGPPGEAGHCLEARLAFFDK